MKRPRPQADKRRNFLQSGGGGNGSLQGAEVIEPEFKEVDPASIDYECLWDYVLCQELRVTKTKGGIHIPGTASSLSEVGQAKVLKAGPGMWQQGVWIENPIKVGDIVYHNALQAPITMNLNGVILFTISASLLMGIKRAKAPTPIVEQPESSKDY
jgi:co-chaperonin GroES (HSP10)